MVDDAQDLRLLLKTALERDGHTVVCAADTAGAEAELAGPRPPDLLLLDVMMPGEDGFSFCRRVRGLVDCPILFLTAREAEEDAVAGFSLGADDYISKPFRLAELRARVAAHLRRSARAPRRLLADGPLQFDLAGHELWAGGQKLPLTRAEYAICELLARSPGAVYTREQLIEAVFGYESESDPAAVTEHIKNIRAKLAVAGAAPIETVWGIGYKWNRTTPPRAPGV